MESNEAEMFSVLLLVPRWSLSLVLLLRLLWLTITITVMAVLDAVDT